MTREELIDYLAEEIECERTKFENLDCSALVSEWCDWEGVLNYGEQIIDVVFAAYEPILLSMAFNETDEDEQPSKLAELYEEMTDAQKDEFLRLTENS